MSSKKNEIPALLVALVCTAALTWGCFLLLRISLRVGDGILTRDRSTDTLAEVSEESPRSALVERQSPGGQVFFTQNLTPEKQAATEALRAGNDGEAVRLLEASLQQNPNDPEARIYLNNARVLQETGYSSELNSLIDAILVSVPITSDPNGSLEILRGVAQAQEEANAAGGRLLFIWIADDENDPAIAEEIANFAVEADFIKGVVGHYASDVTLTAAPIYEEGRVVAISPVSTSVRLSNYGDYIFRTVPSDFVAARALANYLLETVQQRRAAVFFNSESAYSQSLMSEFSSALSLGGGQVVSLVDLSDSGFSAAASLEEATQKGAEALVLLPNTGRLDESLQLVQLAQGRFTLLAGDDVYTSKTLEVGGQAADGMVVAVPWHILAHEGSGFVSASRQLWRGDVNWRTVTAYDATRALVQAFSREGTSPSREQVQQALRSPTFQADGATEAVQFLPSGDRNMGIQLVRVQPGFRSGLAFEFVPINAR